MARKSRQKSRVNTERVGGRERKEREGDERMKGKSLEGRESDKLGGGGGEGPVVEGRDGGQAQEDEDHGFAGKGQHLGQVADGTADIPGSIFPDKGLKEHTAKDDPGEGIESDQRGGAR